MKRAKLNVNCRPVDTIVQMAEGNPGAVTVLTDLFNLGPIHVLDLDDMNIRGEQIWVAYKDHCKGNLAALAECLTSRDRKMVETVNKACPNHKAVTGGTS